MVSGVSGLRAGFSLAIALGAPALSAELPLPESKSIAIRFDASIVEVSPKTDRRITLFARYWVTPNTYTVRIIWAEPQGRALEFPGYPVGLALSSDTEKFRLIRDTYPVKEDVFSKPLGTREVLRSILGSYPNENIRFAESEAL